jgi:hypothetical protein
MTARMLHIHHYQQDKPKRTTSHNISTAAGLQTKRDLRMEQMTWIQSPDSYFLKDQYCQQSLSVTGHTIIKKIEH